MRNDIKLEPWQIRHEGKGAQDDFAESVFFTGNGRMGTRGYCALAGSCDNFKAGIFTAGVFANVKNKQTDIVNLPTPFCYEIQANHEATKHAPEKIERTLDLHGGLVTLSYSLSFGSCTVDVKEERFLSLQNKGLLVARYTFSPHSCAEIAVSTGINPSCCNRPVCDDQTKTNEDTIRLISHESQSFDGSTVAYRFITNGTNLTVREAMTVSATNAALCGIVNTSSMLGFRFKTEKATESPVVIEQITFLSTSRDVDPSIRAYSGKEHFAELYENNLEEWKTRWETSDIEIKGNKDYDAAVRYAVFQLIANDSAGDPTVSIGARGLTHSRYKGCYFWDTDFFMMPFYLYTHPAAAKNLCTYRADCLPAAKEHARQMNCDGARYPWMTAFDGSEQCESWDIGASELHITADIVYALNRYIVETGDSQFYKEKATPVYVETARFWLSRYTEDKKTGQYNLLFCKGPDEYCGITSNNLFTNFLVKLNLKLAIQACNFLQHEDPRKYKELGITKDEVDRFTTLYQNIVILRDPLTGHYKQDETLDLLEDVDIAKLKQNDAASYRSVCFDRVQRYKVIKQADVLLLMSRFPDDFSKEEKLAAFDDFEKICLHDSTLSFATHALFSAQNGIMEKAQSYFEKAVFLDLKDVMENTGAEGLHAASLGETWQAVIFGFAGLTFKSGKPELDPHLPKNMTEIIFHFLYCQKRYKAVITKKRHEVIEEFSTDRSSLTQGVTK